MYDQNIFLQAIEESFKNHKKYKSTSNKRTKPLYNYISSILKQSWGDEFDIKLMTNISGKYHSRKVNVVVMDENRPVFCVGITATYSSFKKNTKNQITNLIGETANIQSFEQTPYSQLLILRHPCPVIEKDQIKKFENVEESHLEKYIKLSCEVNDIHSPYVIGIILVDIDEDSHKVKAIEPDTIYPKDFAYFLETKLSMENFVREIEFYKRFYKLIN